MKDLTVILPAHPIRVETRLRNNVLWKLIFTNYRSVSRFCNAHPCLYQSAVGGLLNLTIVIYHRCTDTALSRVEDVYEVV